MAYFKNLLLLDDEEIDNMMHVFWAKQFNLAENILQFTNPETAKAYIQENGFGQAGDLMIVDIHLPLMSGLDFLEDFFSSNHSTEKEGMIYVLTSSISQRDSQRARNLPISGFLTKPLHEIHIKQIIEKLEPGV
ncbi:MAG: response regulator [Bacteroidota bacterium]